MAAGGTGLEKVVDDADAGAGAKLPEAGGITGNVTFDAPPAPIPISPVKIIQDYIMEKYEKKRYIPNSAANSSSPPTGPATGVSPFLKQL